MALRAAYNGPLPPADVYTPAQLAVEAERVLKRPDGAENNPLLTADKRQQLSNVLLEFASAVEAMDGTPLARKVKFIARRLIGEGARSPVSLPGANQWQHTWDIKFDNNPQYAVQLRAAVHMFYGAMKKKSNKMRGKSGKSRGKSGKSRRR
jgi:hypothetical protein